MEDENCMKFDYLPLELRIYILKLAIGGSRKRLSLVQSVNSTWRQITLDNDVMAPIFDAELKNNELWQAYMSPTILAAWHQQSKKFKPSNNERNEYYQARDLRYYYQSHYLQSPFLFVNFPILKWAISTYEHVVAPISIGSISIHTVLQSVIKRLAKLK